jgi:ADP-ribosylglycohydrolase
MAGALAGAYLGASAIPSSLLGRTEGVDVLRELGDLLLTVSQRA